ncbi:hypothetical protein KKR91_07315 [Arthrobacter jiangjiafuii]|uniref:Lipoprotein n=1 Tax=Arthrobacter jiangjiafuii TaxID=2817475 RepID=A0A975M7J8_9MICC|nr:hypothetical protein [Arthrobacter jiangjiafuii]QWC11352.1 hypothetical protein KKR91_07315 [Arthrobacter jiangjiafuii]
MTLLLVGLLGLAGCAGNPNADPTEPPAPTAAQTQKEPMNAELTWQEAKAHTQAMEREIAALIPKDAVLSIDQQQTGTLLSCNKTQHHWAASTTVTVAEGTEIEPIVKTIEAHYRANGTEVSVDRDINENYRIQIDPPAPGESHLVSEGDSPNEIRIASGSACFTLPEGIYPGGDF